MPSSSMQGLEPSRAQFSLQIGLINDEFWLGEAWQPDGLHFICHPANSLRATKIQVKLSGEWRVEKREREQLVTLMYSRQVGTSLLDDWDSLSLAELKRLLAGIRRDALSLKAMAATLAFAYRAKHNVNVGMQLLRGELSEEQGVQMRVPMSFAEVEARKHGWRPGEGKVGMGGNDPLQSQRHTAVPPGAPPMLSTQHRGRRIAVEDEDENTEVGQEPPRVFESEHFRGKRHGNEWREAEEDEHEEVARKSEESKMELQRLRQLLLIQKRERKAKDAEENRRWKLMLELAYGLRDAEYGFAKADYWKLKLEGKTEGE
ncbi:hypothetical protein BU16DRAFT_562078 [Lophium mytilinum]|uniref:Uncharacterized protein n=1 Tax=Lophium mytilinum TaxID=390894 RepID=A0A6A6QQJ7_9PEZI|nr:hypothetical protein BU16DRAFT_562078 [Lophium mytilinum]